MSFFLLHFLFHCLLFSIQLWFSLSTYLSFLSIFLFLLFLLYNYFCLFYLSCFLSKILFFSLCAWFINMHKNTETYTYLLFILLRVLYFTQKTLFIQFSCNLCNSFMMKNIFYSNFFSQYPDYLFVSHIVTVIFSFVFLYLPSFSYSTFFFIFSFILILSCNYLSFYILIHISSVTILYSLFSLLTSLFFPCNCRHLYIPLYLFLSLIIIYSLLFYLFIFLRCNYSLKISLFIFSFLFYFLPFIFYRLPFLFPFTYLSIFLFPHYTSLFPIPLPFSSPMQLFFLLLLCPWLSHQTLVSQIILTTFS